MFLFGQLDIESVQNLSLKDGLSDRAVLDIVQDSEGFIWIATNNGLNRYDGYNFQVFDNNEQTKYQLAQSRIHKMEELEGAKLGLFNKNNLSYFEILDLHNFQTEKIGLGRENGLSGSCQTVFFEHKGGVFALTTTEGNYQIFRSDKNFSFQQIANVAVDSTAQGNRIKFHVGKSGNCWLFDDYNGLFKVGLDGAIRHHWPMKTLIDNTLPSSVTYRTGLMHEDQSGKLWLALPFRNGLINIRADQTDISFPPNLPKDEVFTKICEDHKGNLTIGSFLSYGKTKQLFHIKKDGTVENHQALLDIEVTTSEVYHLENENAILLGTFVGMYKIDLVDRAVSWLLAERQLEDNQWDDGISIRGITGDDADNIFISRELSAWYQTNQNLEPTTEIELFDQAGMAIKLWCCSNLVWDPKGAIWGGSCAANRDGLLHRYDLTSRVTKTFAIPGKAIRHMAWAKNGQLTLATGATGMEGNLIFFDTEKEIFSVYKDTNGSNPFGGRESQYVLESQDGYTWIGTQHGLLKINVDAQSSVLYQKGNSQLTNDDIMAIHEDEDGLLWLGTHGGLNIFNPKTEQVKSYNISHGLSNNIIAGIIPDGENGYWLSTFYGLSHFDPDTEFFSTFYKDKGLTFNEFNRLSFHRDNAGKFYFGTINGINVFKNDDLKKAPSDKMEPKWIRISVSSRGQERLLQQTEFDELSELVLSHKDDLVQFEFCLPVFENVAGNRFAVMLEGRDTAWQYLGNKNYYELNHPAPGRYVFRVKAVASNGLWGKGELSIKLKVDRAFYEATWFMVAVPASILLIGYLVSKLYISRIRKKEEEQTRINKRFAELELQALQAQMNPHFVFNSLGAIQYFIQNNNSEAADDYLAKFAKLMRLFLESSKNKYISLAEEIKLLSLYIELEQMRFGDKFAGKIIVEESIDPHSRELPSVLIQPFVENAINHGLFNKSSSGELVVKFKEGLDDSLICLIEDNGVGRENADKLKKASSQNYKSRGMQIVRERLEVLQEVDDVRINVKVEDLDAKSSDPGTLVSIEILNID